MRSHITKPRLRSLPEVMRQQLKEARQRHGWSQAELGHRIGLPQMHISGIESGKVVPRFDTLLDLVRMLDYDLLMIPRTLVPAVQALVRDHRRPVRSRYAEGDERSLYADREEVNEAKDEV
jgi:transcriptional regulator with XRE-family HTH domain